MARGMNAATARSARLLAPWIAWISLPVAWCIVFGRRVQCVLHLANTDFTSSLHKVKSRLITFT